MDTLIASLPKRLQAELDHLRSRIHDFATRRPQAFDLNGPDIVSQANQALEVLEQWLLDEEQKQWLQLNPMDIFLLYASVYCSHLNLSDNQPASGSKGAPSTNRYQRCRQLILAHWKALGIGDAAMAAAIADICGMGDWKHGLSGAAGTLGAHQISGRPVNAGLLAAAVWLTVALNPKTAVSADRICSYLAADGLPPDAYKEAFTVKHMGPHPYLPATIQVEIQCRHADIHRALKQHERTIQNQLHEINRVASPRFLYSDVLFEIEADGYTPMDLKFSVDTSAALQLLTGNRLYSDNRVFLRELIQNAVDACNLRKRLEKEYVPAISIRFNKDISRVSVRDNGIGMDRQWIEKYFLTIGISLYQSSEVHSAGKRSRIDFNFISQFGIGFLSSFLVADKIVIKTRKAGSDGLMISITNLRDYFDVRPLNRDFAPGTEVILNLKPSKINYCRSLEYAGYLKTNIRFLNIPVQLKDQDGKVATIGCDTLTYEDPKTADIDFTAPLAFKHSEGYLLLRAKKNVDHIFTMESAKGGVSVFQDGIFITQLDTLLPEGARQNVIGRINLRGQDKCALSMDRNRIFWTEHQLRAIKQTIRMGLASAVNQFLDAIDAQKVEPNTRQSIINNLAIFFDFNEVDDAIHQRLCEPVRRIVEKRFRDFVRIHFAHTLRTEGIPEADGYSQSWQQQIVDSFQKN